MRVLTVGSALFLNFNYKLMNLLYSIIFSPASTFCVLNFFENRSSSRFQKTMEDIFKQKQISQREYFIQKIKEEQEHADLNIKSGDLMSAMAHKLTADWYSSMLVFTTH
jgi:signal-transduction protein with cAMP-binding, CBS, and nucleotidyltransferase domain